MGAIQQKVEDALAAQPQRPVFTYAIPSPLNDKIQSVGFVQLTTEEERTALKLAGNDAAKGMYEQIKAALAEVNGKPVWTSDGSVDKVWEGMDPRVRTLCMMAYQKLHIPENDTVDAFLKSQALRIG